ncbi:MAG TPA: RNA polymerase sigma factor [Gemmataceae bacterium]|jgi:RNA polymerase sigma factor (sigma-70 family)|nr:RNA polymerase sigma factor [Gemmataceae bacterium]
MPKGQMIEIGQQLRKMALRSETPLTDGDLLECYVSRNEEAALAALVRRHGPMVWGVCRRILRNHHDAEDAFQASILFLVRKAASVIPREMVANWLYGVAHQTALKVRATIARRKAREIQVAEMPELAVPKQDSWQEMQLVLDGELSCLPAKYRALIVLCDLEGKTRKQVARQFDCPEGTVAARLFRARTMLAKRLAKRGVVLSVGTLAAALAQNAASACVPNSLLSSTLKAVTLLAAGSIASSAGVSVKVAALSEGVLILLYLRLDRP